MDKINIQRFSLARLAAKVTNKEIARALGFSQTTLRRRLQQNSWRACEVLAVASFLDVDQDFLSIEAGPATLDLVPGAGFEPATTGRVRTR